MPIRHIPPNYGNLHLIYSNGNIDYLAVCFDKGGSQDRIKIFDQYKEHLTGILKMVAI